MPHKSVPLAPGYNLLLARLICYVHRSATTHEAVVA